MKRCAVILVNYQDYADRYLGECYQTLMAQTYPKDFWQLFIVDNASTEQTRSRIKVLAPQAVLIGHSENHGWPGGNNRGIERALAGGFDYFVLLNMDTAVEPSWLEALVKQAEAEKQTHILQSKILIYGTDEINSIGNRIHFLGYGYCNGYRKKKSESIKLPMDFASGASMLIKREVFQRIGLFRENYFMYGEDLEFCWRARLAGFRLGLSEQSICFHKYDYKRILQHAEYVECNRIRTLFSLEKTGSLILIYPIICFSEIVALLYFVLKGELQKAFSLLAFLLSFKTWSEIIEMRNENVLLRKVSDRDLIRDYSASFEMEAGNPVIRFLLKVIVNPVLRIYWGVVRWLIVW